MLPGHQRAARWRANGAAGVKAGEAHALGGQLVEIGRLDPGLAVAPQIPIAEVIGEDEDDAGLGKGIG